MAVLITIFLFTKNSSYLLRSIACRHPSAARGIPENTLLILIALTIVVSMQTVGCGMVTAMLVTPGATAQLLSKRLSTMMAISGQSGPYRRLRALLSFYVNVASGRGVC